MNVDFQFRDKIPVGILGATGSVGQRFVELLSLHPWFEIKALAASERSLDKPYGDAVKWLSDKPLPLEIATMRVSSCSENLPCAILFSALDSSIAGEVESFYANQGYIVISNSRNHRMDQDVPLIIPEVNSDHLALIKHQSYGKGAIVTNPNCSVIGLAIALKPLANAFGLEAVHVTTLQAISGAGYPGVASLDILDNVIPFIDGEEDKVETEPLKIFGKLAGDHIECADFRLSAHCNRVFVSDGHTECVSVKLKKPASKEAMIEAFTTFTSLPQELQLPMAPLHPIHYHEKDSFPQPKRHRDVDKAMAVSIGRLRPCPLMDWKFVILSHNTIRGAAGGAILIAEEMVKLGYIFW